VIIDSHCHLAGAVFAGDLAEVTARAQAAGVSRAMCILSADEPEELERADTVRAAWPTVVFAAAIHPHSAGGFAGRAEAAADATAAALDRTAAVAVGEIGLDYHYDHAPREVQRDVFSAQVGVAAARGLPVVIHTREATDDTCAVLRTHPGIRGVMHCFSGTRDEARQALDLGFYISLSGILTFPRADALREVAAFVPDDRLLVETDAPFLAPVPFRGKRNEPAWVARTLDVLAETRGVASETLAARLAINFVELIGEEATGHAR
jgi:TatD DNase family protein